MRIALIADTHLSPDAPDAMANAAAAQRWLEKLAPDRIVHLGDIVADGVRRPTDYNNALEIFGKVAGSMSWLPGNHDIGEDAITAANTGDPSVSNTALSAWRASFGADYWRHDTAEWTVLGLNSQLCGSGDVAGIAQAEWLRVQIEHARDNVGVMLHKPLFRDSPEDGDTHRRYLPLAARRELWSQLSRANLRFIVSGHTHQWRQHRWKGVELVWAPSLAYTIPDALQEAIGRKVVGAMVLDLTPQGHQFAFVEIHGVRANSMILHE